ncbi:MAG: imidazole glycerol phosphate synthase subunit HisF [Candidatus Hydrogenedentes bacterium]|nr:imidazole glycerol phosphate synthase subunit HisF [Candidatus Hydrogenedentota bacterium]
MLKLRVIPTLLYRDFGLVKGVGFDSWRPVGSAMQAVKVYNMREVDELVFLDIRATADERPPDFAIVDELADECFMPMTVGGGVRSVDDARRLLQVGADKVAVGAAAAERPQLVREIAERFGAQCVVVSIDVRRPGGGPGEACIRAGTRPTGKEPVAFAQEMESLGAGEILLQSIERDGTMEGYDLELIRRVSDAVSIPVIASGGAGNYDHLAGAVLDGHASAVAAASIFHFTQQTPLEAKRHLAGKGIAVRL